MGKRICSRWSGLRSWWLDTPPATSWSWRRAPFLRGPQAGADVVSVAEVMGTDPRIGRAFLDAGLGYGGYCFPKDLAAFRRLSSRLGYEFELLQNVERINDEAVEFAFRKIERALWNMEE